MSEDLRLQHAKGGWGIRVLLTLTDWASYIVLTLMALIICVDIACRAILGFSTQIAEASASLGLVCLVFLSLAGAFHEGGFLRIDALFATFPETLKRVLDAIFSLIGLAVTLVYIYFTATLAQNSFEKNIRSDSALHSPNALPQSVMVIGMLALAIVLVVAFISAVRSIGAKGTDHA